MGEQAFAAKRSGAVDLLTGAPWKKILRFAVPLFIGNLFQQFYNTADSIIVGRFVGHIALAAVGVSGPLMFLLVSIFMGVAMGSGILISQYFGARNEAALRRTMHTALVLAFWAGLILSIIGYVLTVPFLRFMNVPEETFVSAEVYMKIIFIGVTAMMMYNMLSGFMRSLGNSRTPLYILIFSTLTNVVLDLLFVVPMGMGVAGAAWATIISQFLSCIITIISLHRTSPLTRIVLKELRVDWDATREIIRLGIPTAIQQGVMSVGGVVIQGFVNSYGTAMIAGHNAAMRVDMFALMPVMSFSMSMVSYTGQNVGAGQMDRVYLGAKQGMTLCISFIAFMSFVLYFFGQYVLHLFTDDVQTLAAGVMIIRTVSPFYIFMAAGQMLGGVIRGSGETMSPMLNALMTNIFARIPLVFLLSYLLPGAQGIYLSQVGGMAFGLVHMLYIYSRGSWKKKALERIDFLQRGKTDSPAAEEAGRLQKAEEPLQAEKLPEV